MEPTIPVPQVYDHVSYDIGERADVLPAYLVETYKNVPDAIKHMDEDELRSKFKITVMDERIRTNLWREIQIALNTNRKVKPVEIYTGVCSYQKFQTVCRDPHKLAFLMLPAVSYETKTEHLLNMAVGRYQQLLTMDITDKKKVAVEMYIDDDGKQKMKYELQDVINPIKAKVLLDVIRNLEERVKGASVQRSVNIHESSKDIEGQYKDLTDMNLINEKLKELENRLSNVPQIEEVREDIEYIDV